MQPKMQNNKIDDKNVAATAAMTKFYIYFCVPKSFSIRNESVLKRKKKYAKKQKLYEMPWYIIIV